MLTDLIIYTPMYITGFWAIMLLLSAGQKNTAKQFLGVFMILAFGVYFSHALYFQKQYSGYLIFDSVYIFCSLSVYPMYYWYIRLLTVDSEIRLNRLWLLFPAFFFGVSSSIIYFLMSPAARMDYILTNVFGTRTIHMDGQLFKIQHIIYHLSRVTFIVQIFLFLILGRKLVLRYNSRVSNFYATPETKTIGWVNLLLYSFFVTSLMSIIFSLVGRSVFLESDSLLLIPSAIFSVLLFLIGFLGYMQNYTVVDLVEDELELVEFSIKQYNQAQLKDRFLELFENQHIYRQCDLKITQISMILQTNRTYISNLINTEFNSTFSDFVNRYRVAEARKLLADSKQQNYSLNYVSEASGFGSVNSFIRIFRESEGITPGKFRDRIFLQAKEALEVKR